MNGSYSMKRSFHRAAKLDSRRAHLRPNQYSKILATSKAHYWFPIFLIWGKKKKKNDISACKFEAQKLIREALTSLEFEASQIQILDLETRLQSLRDRIDKPGVNNQVEKLISAMESLKVFFL